MDSTLNGSRRRRRSSLVMSSYYSPTLSSLTTTTTTGNISISSPLKSKCNVKLREINNERLRKQNQYKQKKLLRAKLLETKRNIDLANQVEEDERANIDESDDEAEHEELHFESKELLECKTEACQDEQNEEQEENRASEIKMNDSKIPTQIINKQIANGTIRSAIYNGFNSIRSKFRNMINVSNEQRKKIEISNVHKPIVNKNLTKIMEPTVSTTIKSAQTSHLCKQRSNSSLMHDPFAKVRRADDQMKRSVSATNVKRCLRKQESTTSCRSMKINEHHGSFGNLASNRPAFKITKIKYDDRHLFSTSPKHIQIDKDKYNRMIKNRKVASHLT